jgi:hypothetical protein
VVRDFKQAVREFHAVQHRCRLRAEEVL